MKESLKFIKSYDDISVFIDGPFNDPLEEREFDETQFEVEYEKVRIDIVRLCQSFCIDNGLSFDSVSVGNRTGFSRGVGVVVDESVASMLKHLLRDLQNLLRCLPVAYCIPINLILDSEGQFKDLYIAVLREEIFIHADKKSWFKEIGLL